MFANYYSFLLYTYIYYSAVVEQGVKEHGDEVGLVVRSREPDDDVERDSVRHRVSEQTLPNDSDSSD